MDAAYPSVPLRPPSYGRSDFGDGDTDRNGDYRDAAPSDYRRHRGLHQGRHGSLGAARPSDPDFTGIPAAVLSPQKRPHTRHILFSAHHHLHDPGNFFVCNAADSDRPLARYRVRPAERLAEQPGYDGA